MVDCANIKTVWDCAKQLVWKTVPGRRRVVIKNHRVIDSGMKDKGFLHILLLYLFDLRVVLILFYVTLSKHSDQKQLMEGRVYVSLQLQSLAGKPQ